MEKSKSLEEVLEGIDDFRQENSVYHKLTDILIIAILATICGAESYVQIFRYAQSKEAWLRRFLELANGIPSAYTIRRVLMNIDPAQFHAAFIEWVGIICDKISGLVAIDGKTARRTKGVKAGKKALHVVSAFAVENKLVLGQIVTDTKSNEITAIPELLNMLDLKGCIVTIDAMGTQKNIAQTIVDNGADYVLSLKENQKALHDDVALYMQTEVVTKDKEDLRSNNQYHCTYDNDHGRLEKREYYTCDDVDWIEQRDEWANLSGFGLCVSTVTKTERVKTEIDGVKAYELREVSSVSEHLCIYSIKDMTAERFAELKRGHWGIENSLHWCLDMSFREDESRARADHSAENINIIRHLSYNLLRVAIDDKVSVSTKRLMCAWDNKYVEKVAGRFGLLCN